MSSFQKMSESIGLVSGMAERLGVDSDARLAHEKAGGRSYVDMVLRCTGCSNHAACARLQDENLLLDEAPSFCRNKDVLTRN